MHIPPRDSDPFGRFGREVAGCETVDAISAEHAQGKGKEEGDHAGRAQDFDPRQKMVTELVHGRVWAKRVGNREHKKADQKCDVRLSADAR